MNTTIKTETKQSPASNPIHKQKGLPMTKFDLDHLIRLSPTLIQSASSSFSTPSERLVALYSTITQSAVSFPNAWVNYRNQRNYLHTYLLIVGPAGNGKGALSQVSKLLAKVVRKNIEENNHLLNKYKAEIDLYKKNKSKVVQTKPTAPLLPIVSIPGNISSAKFAETLKHNHNILAVMIETELDSFGMASKTEHGNLNSTYLRQCFHSETISVARKTDSVYYFIENPKLALTLSGTPSQLNRVFKSNEDGLYSRFLVISLDENPTWDDTRPCKNCVSLDEKFESYSDDFFKMYEKMKGVDVEVQFSDKQWDKINDFGVKHLGGSYNFVSEHAASIAKRHGLMLVRLAGVLTMFRYYELGLTTKHVKCSDQDLYIAFKLAEFSIENSLSLFQELPKYTSSNITSQKRNFVSMLPDSFSSPDITSCANTLKLSNRTTYRYLTQLISSGIIEKIAHGSYVKTPLALLAVGKTEEAYTY